MVEGTGVQRADDVADRAARQAGVVTYLIHDEEDVAAVEQLFLDVWGGESQMPAPVVRALIEAGNYVSGAAADGQLVGASIGFFGCSEQALHLHSHMTGIAASMQGRGVGYALKQHQRAWAIRRGLREIRWTFDPLVRRNGYFNVVKLGADIVAYRPNFYGAMRDGLNRDDESDRCVVAWELDSERAWRAADGENSSELALSSCSVLVNESADGLPLVACETADTLIVYVPADIVNLRRTAPTRAHAWRRASREAFTWAFSEGYRVIGMTRKAAYILRRR